jgi:MFS family permease
MPGPSAQKTHQLRTTLCDFYRLPDHARLLLISQLCFNIGFYMVLPYLATYLRDHLGLAGTTIGLILGLRAFSQQGLFMVGGMLADRYGPRLVILADILIRIAGFLMLGLNTLIAGVIMIGFAAALFSPAVESSIARVAGDVERETSLPRTQVFSMGTVSLQLGATVGPLIGALLLVNYRLSCLVAAGVFACMWLAYLAIFPNIAPLHKNEPILEGWGEILSNRVFLLFALATARTWSPTTSSIWPCRLNSSAHWAMTICWAS